MLSPKKVQKGTSKGPNYKLTLFEIFIVPLNALLVWGMWIVF